MKRAGALVALALVVPMLAGCNDRDRCDSAPAPGTLQVQTASLPMPVTPIIPPRPVIIPPRPVIPARPAPGYRPVQPQNHYHYHDPSPWHGNPLVPLLPFLLMKDCR